MILEKTVSFDLLSSLKNSLSCCSGYSSSSSFFTHFLIQKYIKRPKIMRACTTIIQKFLVAALSALVKNLSLSVYTAYVTKNEITNPIGMAPQVSIRVKRSLHKNLETRTVITKVMANAMLRSSWPAAYQAIVPFSL